MVHALRPRANRVAHRSDGQTLTEFALVITVFLVVLLGVFDAGRAIFAFNGTSQAARQVARVASVSCFEGTTTATRCNSTEVAMEQAAQGVNLPGAATWLVRCIDPFTGIPPTGRVCKVGDMVEVRATTSFTMITPLIAQAFGPVNVASTSQVEILR